MTQTPNDVHALLERYGIRPRKSLGQHFLADPNVTAKIAALATGDGRILEIGAGTGTLTKALAEAGHRVLAYEVDQRLRPLLEEVLADCANVEVRFEDVTRVDLQTALGPDPWTLVANLPYNVGTPLVMDLLRNVPAVRRYVVMVQREVGDRLVAEPGSRRYGIPSVVVRLFGEARIRFRVPSRLFVPPPNVESAVLTVERRPDVPELAPRAADLAAAAFGQRRKMLRSSLAGALSDVETVLGRAGIDLRVRAENLHPDDYVRIAAAEAAG